MANKEKKLKINSRYLNFIVIVIFISTLVALAVQFYKGYLFDVATSKDKQIFYVLAIFGGLIVAEIITYYVLAKFEAKFITSKKAEIESQIVSVTEKKRDMKLDYVTKYVDIIERDYLTIVPQYIYTIFRVIVMAIGLIYFGVIPFLIAAFFLTLPVYLPKLLSKRLNEFQKEKVESYANLLEKLQEIVSKLKLINFSLFKSSYRQRVDELIKHTEAVDYKFRVYNAKIRIISSIASYFSHFTILVYGLVNVYNGNLTIGSVVVLLGLVEQLSYPILSLSMFRQMIIGTAVIREELEEVLSTSEVGTEVIEDIQTINMSNVSVKFNDKEIVKPVSYEFIAGNKYLIKGNSGSGKTVLMETLMNLVNFEGSVKYNGVDIENVNVYDSVCYINSSNFVVGESVQFNISSNEVNLTEFDIPNEDDANVLSQGEKKRLAVLKGLLDKRSVVIFDEPFSNMQEGIKEKLLDEIMALQNNIVIVISHDLLEHQELFDKVIEIK